MKTMKSLILLLVVGLFLFAGTSYAAEKGKGEKPSIDSDRLVTMTSTVQAVDAAKRTVTLKKPNGEMVTLKLGDEVRNLDQVKVGDKVVVKYYEALAVRVSKKGEKGASVQETTERAKPGEKPAGAVVQETTLTATVKAIDKKAPTVTLQGPEGNTRTIKVRDPKNLENVKVGDYVTMTYTEAVAVSVEKP